MIGLWWPLAVGHAAPCPLDAPADAPFSVSVEAARVQAVVEIWTAPGADAWASGLLDTLDARGLAGVLVVPLKALPLDPSATALVSRAAEGPHDIAVALDERQVPRDILGNTKDLKAALRPLNAVAGKVRVVAAPIGSKGSEALLGRAGFRTLINLDGPPVATPRYAGHFEGQAIINVVLHAGPYDGDCGPDPRVGPFTPLAADRAADVLQRARRDASPIVRVALDGTHPGAHDADVLGRWLDDVVLPGGVDVVAASAARLAALRDFRRGVEAPRATEDLGGGRLLSAEERLASAAHLAEGTLLPRRLDGDVSPTEAFYGFVLHLTADDDTAPVRIGALRGPGSLAQSSLEGRTELPRDAVVAAAAALVAAVPTEVPAALPVDGTLLTATELLVALASAVRGDDPVVTRPMAVPEPNERGLGWGVAELP